MATSLSPDSKRTTFFLISLDTEYRWFRYHHLFKQLLRDQLNRHWRPEEIAALHSRANAWFAENDTNDDAIKQPPAAFREAERDVAPESADRLSRSHQPLVDPLTNRELDVLDLLAQRLSNKEIADKMFISTSTVKSHIQNLYRKLNVRKRREAVEKAKKIGIL